MSTCSTTQSLHHARVMAKRSTALIVLGLLLVATVCLVSLWPTGEPSYKGRSLSEWLDRRQVASTPVEAIEAQAAILGIGSNAVPYLVKRMQSKPEAWRVSLYRMLPRMLQQKNAIHSWLFLPGLRANYACEAICNLGTNAACAIPELETMSGDLINPWRSDFAFIALAGIGEPAAPVLRAAFVDTNRVDQVVRAILSMTSNVGHTNASFSLVIEALNHQDASVRDAATNAVAVYFPQLLTNAPLH